MVNINKKILICGAATNFNKEFVKEFKKSGGYIFAVNGHNYGVNYDFVLFQDVIKFIGVKLFQYLNARFILKDTLKEQVPRYFKNIEYFRRVCSFEQIEEGLLAYPYSGLGALHWCINKGFKNIYITGFDFSYNHNQFAGYIERRELYCAEQYLNNYKRLCNLAKEKGLSVWILMKN